MPELFEVIGVLHLQGDVAEARSVRSGSRRARPLPCAALELEPRRGGRPGHPGGGVHDDLEARGAALEADEAARRSGSVGGAAGVRLAARMIMLADRLLDGIGGQETFGGIDMTGRNALAAR